MSNYAKEKLKRCQLERIEQEKYNNKNCLMKIIEYNGSGDIIVEFQDKHKARVHAAYREFESGEVKNPYYPSVYGVGITGNKYPTRVNGGTQIKEYNSWKTMLIRCFDNEYKRKHHTYKDATCCDEWLYFENFYEWVHEQSNFEKWFDGEHWNLDKDIIFKRNKIYSPETCCLVPQNVNNLFIKNDANRGSLPIGVYGSDNGYGACCNNSILNRQEFLRYHDTPERAFLAYKKYKEALIKQVAKIEFDNGNITEKCYNAMMKYVVEIDD